MNLNKLTITFALTLLLTACGGSGGGNSNNTGNGESNNTSSTEIVFGDSLNSSWGKFTAYEWSNTSNSGFNYADGQTTNFLRWKIVQAPSAEHSSVIEVNYATDQDLRWAQFYITPTTPADLSKYETGTFSFDINVLDWGDAYDSTTGTATFEVRVECGWPCSSHPVNVVVGKTSQWEHVDIKVTDFANSGADLTKLDGTFLIKPIIGKQKGTRYQLDNIKWTKGPTVTKKKIIFEEHFNTYASKDAWVANPNYTYTYINDGLLVATSWSQNNIFNDWSIERTLTTPINIDHKNVKYLVNPDISLKGNATLELIAIDTNGNQAYVPSIYLGSLAANNWNQVSFNVDTAGVTADYSFNPASVNRIKIIFHSNGQQNIDGKGTGWLTIDEILITE